MKQFLMGPYIGDFKHEIEEFYPFVSWIYENITKDFYLSTHFNRSFMYDFVDKKIPFYEILSREEEKQHGYLHSDINARDYVSIIVKTLKDEIVEETNCLKKDLMHYNISYIKTANSIPLCQKLYKQIKFNKCEKKIVFIPDNSGDFESSNEILKFLKENYNEEFLIVGDTKTYFNDENIVLKQYDYFENGYRKIINLISNARIVITPCSHWTLLSNLQKVPVISWGDCVSQYKENGIYNIENKDCHVSPFINSKCIVNQIENILKRY